MSKASLDEERNIVIVKYEGNVNVKDARRLHEQLQAVLSKCCKGFKMLVDLSTLSNIDQEVVPLIRKMMDLCNQYGVSEIARIIPDPNKDIGFNLLSIFHYDKDVRVRTYQSFEQLDQEMLFEKNS